MALVIAEFFNVIGVDAAAPTTMAELIPWALSVYIGVMLVCGVFRVFGKLAELLMNGRRF